MEELLIQAGLTDTQSAAYLYLLENGPSAPPAVAKACGITRTNAYKVLDSLQEVDLAIKKEANKKFVYEPADPTALASLVAERRNQVLALEQNVKIAMRELRSKYRRSTTKSTVSQSHGSSAIARAYSSQVDNNGPIYFIKSRADIPFMGYETMSKMRHLGVSNHIDRFGITPDAREMNPDRSKDAHTFLTRTIIPAESYMAPVEWTVSGDELCIIKFDGEGVVLKISDSDVAEAFRQVWHLLDKNIRSQPTYTTHAPRAKRAK